MTTDGRKELIALRDLLNTSIDSLLADESLPELPSLGSAKPGPPLLNKAGKTACAAAVQLQALLGGPVWPMSKAMESHVGSSLRVAVEAHVVETIREAGGEGVHVEELARSSTIDPTKLARILRLLAAHHIFTETAPDTFANNRCSIPLDTGKSVKDLKTSCYPYEGTDGYAALVVHFVDEGLKSTAYLAESVLSAETARSNEPSAAPWCISAKTDQPIWEHWSRPENEQLMARFGMAMIGAASLGGGFGDVLLPGGYDFAGLKKGSTLVDVGGGVGAVSLVIAKAAPDLNIVLEDRPEVLEGEAKKVWTNSNPSALESGRVQLRPHDFFKEQPVKEADVYLMRAIVHDWSTPYAIKIMKHLADAASPSSTLVLIEHVIEPLSPSPKSTAPFPLLPSHGATLPFLLDLQMLCVLNAQERTEPQFRELGEQSGWKLERIARGEIAEGFCHIIFSRA